MVTQIATSAAGRSHSIDPVQAVEWMMADISCLVTDDGVEPSTDEWRSLETIAGRNDWPQPVACRFVSPLLIAPTFQPAQVEPNTRVLAMTWWSLFKRYPLKMTFVHLRRVNLFLPPFVGGMPELSQTPFIMITAESKTENVIAAKKAGVSNYIVKPFNAATLKTKMEAVFPGSAE